MKSDGWTISGTTRDLDKRNRLRDKGIDAYLFDYEHPLIDPLRILDGTTHLLISTPPGDEGDPAFDMYAREIEQLETLEWVGYISTTGVYGNRDGEWVDEESEIRPSSQRGSRRAKAEEQWQSLDIPLHIFRLAGIYGPGRSALDSIRAGMAQRIDKPGQAFSRIHVEDIINVIMASFENPNPGRAYNVCDDLPAPSHEVVAYGCELLGRPPPPLVPFAEANLSPMARSFYNDNKRIKNDRIKNELGVKLKYETYKEGLKACLKAENHAVSLFKGMGN